MKNSIPIRIAGLVAVVALAASACSSSGTSTTEGPVFNPTTTTEPEPAPPPAPAPAIELVAATMDEIGVTSVVPEGWIATPEGAFLGEDAVLAFGAFPSWAAPDPSEVGYAAVDRQQLGGRWWDMYAAESDGVTEVLTTAAIGTMTYVVVLAVPPHLVDYYIDSVGTPVLEAFEVDALAPAPGEIALASVTIDGRTIAYAVGGSSDTTVVFETGHGGGMADWALVAPEVAEFASILAYDRPGYGGSDPTETPRDGATMVAELRQLLLATGHEPPYVLVGWSLGGTVMDLYARTHPDEVSGLVLVDSRHHDYTARCVAELGEVGGCVIPEEEVALMPPHMVDEWRAFSITEQQLAAAPGLDQALPLVVIAAGQPGEDAGPVGGWELWQATQREYAALVPGARLIVVDDSDHQIPGRQPGVIVDSIAELLHDKG